MFAGFNLTIDIESFNNMIMSDGNSFASYKILGEEILKDQKAKCTDKLEEYVKNGIVDGTKLESDWFPEIKADIFISHSHDDKDLTSALAGWLYKKFGIKCFIDSHVWGYVDNLLEMINQEYSEKRPDSSGGYVYSHKKCNIAASHVNMMLCMALQKMIDKTEAVFVINTESSIRRYEDIYETATFSPWIYSELVCTQIVRNKELSEYRKRKEIISFNENYIEINNSYQAAYKVSLDHLEHINTLKLSGWAQKWSDVNNKKGRYSLDELYKITHPDKVKELINVHNSIILG